MSADTSIDACAYVQVVTTIFRAAGVTPEDADAQARILLEGDLRGHGSHGLRRLPVLIDRFRRGLIRTGVDVQIDWVSDAFAHIDGMDGFGAVVSSAAIDAVTGRARSSGVAVAAVRRSNHIGMVAPYVEKIVSAGQIGLVLTTSEALVHPWGGSRPLIGTNPIGIGIPSHDDPLILDMSTAAVSMGRILDYAQRGRSLPLGWASDASGNPTTNARAASAGAISPFGGAKGYAFGVALETLVAVLTGTSLGADKHGTLDATHPSTKGDVFMAIDVQRLGLQDSLPAVSRYFDQLRASGVDRARPVVIPGDRARSVRKERLRSGVPVHAAVWNQTMILLEAAEGGGVAWLNEPA